MATSHVLGIGGTFFRSKDPEALASWYEEHFGIPGPQSGRLWIPGQGPIVFAPFEQGTDYFGSDGQQFMINFRISELVPFLSDLKAAGVVEIKERESHDGIGMFAWIEDPEGNRIELWEPIAGMRDA